MKKIPIIPIILIAAVLLLPFVAKQSNLVSAAGVTVSASPAPRLQFLNTAGVPYSGGSLYTYYPGTTTLRATYTDYTGTVQNANPIVLDSLGTASVWLYGAVKFALYDANGVLVYTQDNVSPGAPAGSFASISAVLGPSFLGSLQISGTLNPLGPATFQGNVTDSTTSTDTWQGQSVFTGPVAFQGIISTSSSANATWNGTSTFKGILNASAAINSTSITNSGNIANTGSFTNTGAINANGGIVGNVTGNASGSAGTVTSLTGHTTTEITEGANLYYTNARVQANRLDQMTAPTSDISLNNQNLTNGRTLTGSSIVSTNSMTLGGAAITVWPSLGCNSNCIFAGTSSFQGNINTSANVTANFQAVVAVSQSTFQGASFASTTHTSLTNSGVSTFLGAIQDSGFNQGTAGQVLASSGAGKGPTWITAASSDCTSNCTFTGTTTFAGTKHTSLTNSGVSTFLGAIQDSGYNQGTLGQVLQSNGTGLGPSWTTFLTRKTGNFSRDYQSASGSQSVTGVGFTPSSIQFYCYQTAATSPSWNVSVANSASSYAGVYFEGAVVGYQDNINGGAALILMQGSGLQQSAVIASMDVDGFTLTWTRTGATAPGTIWCDYMAINK